MQKTSYLSSLCLLVAATGCGSEDPQPTPTAPAAPNLASEEPALDAMAPSATSAADAATVAGTGDADDADEATAPSATSATDAAEPATPEPATPLVASGAFATDADRERFETEVLPSARAFLAYWAEAGLSAPHEPVRLFVSPPSETKASEGLPKLYGEGIFDELRALEAEVAAAASNRDAVERIDAFACLHPPLERNFLEEVEEHIDDPAIGPADIAEALRQDHAEKLLGPDATFSFRTDNGEFELPLRRNCSYILLGHATDPTRAHPYLEKDVVNHELGHALHYGLWLASGPLGERLSSSANEAIADILAHMFDGDPCHGKVLDEQGAPVGCRRRMDTYERSVSDAVWQFGRADHESGQALRQLVWTLREQVAPDALRAAIRDGIAAVQSALNQIDQEPLANAPVFDDEILAVRYRFVREYEASLAFFDALCGSLGDAPTACGEQEQRIGDPRLEMREAWLESSPTAIGESGITLADGRQVAFQLDGALIQQMIVTLPDGEREIYLGDPDLGLPQVETESPSGRITLWFSAPDSATPDAQVGWSSDGELTER